MSVLHSVGVHMAINTAQCIPAPMIVTYLQPLSEVPKDTQSAPGITLLGNKETKDLTN